MKGNHNNESILIDVEKAVINMSKIQNERKSQRIPTALYTKMAVINMSKIQNERKSQLDTNLKIEKKAVINMSKIQNERKSQLASVVAFFTGSCN